MQAILMRVLLLLTPHHTWQAIIFMAELYVYIDMRVNAMIFYIWRA